MYLDKIQSNQKQTISILEGNKMRKFKPLVTVEGWNVYREPWGFYCANNGKTLGFTAEYRNGLYSKLLSYYDGKRAYHAQRYLIKMIPLVSKIAFELLKNNELWDEKNDCPALDTYKKDIEPYYRKCIDKGLPLYNDTEFLNNLFN